MEKGEVNGHHGEIVESAAKERTRCWYFFAREPSPAHPQQNRNLFSGRAELGRSRRDQRAESDLPSSTKQLPVFLLLSCKHVVKSGSSLYSLSEQDPALLLLGMVGW